MDCRRAEELLSDHLEGVLEEPLLSEVGSHLTTCASCRELREAVSEVVAALKSHPALAPPEDLAERAARAALARRKPLRFRFRLRWPLAGVPLQVQAAAAVLALVLGSLVLLATSPGAARSAVRFKERTYNTGVYVLERKDRLVEDLKILNVTLQSAFGSRVDRWGDRVEDYRRLLGRKRSTPNEPRKTEKASFAEPAPGGTRNL